MNMQPFTEFLLAREREMDERWLRLRLARYVVVDEFSWILGAQWLARQAARWSAHPDYRDEWKPKRKKRD